MTTPKNRRGARLLAPPAKDARALSRHAPSVRLDAATVPDTDAPVWEHVATEGTWEGHPMGPFTFDRGVFQSLIDNLHKHPWFQAGPDGVGCADVVQYDFHHASEAPAVEGDIPVVGAPAQAWVLDLKIQDGADGKAQLWALTRFLPLARQYVREGKYRSASVAVWFDAIDPVTGKNHGPELTSIAFTNHPFIQGMSPLTAARLEASILRDPSAEWGPIKEPSDILGPLARMFDLPDETADDALLPAVQAKVAQLKAWLMPGAVVPSGIDPLYAASELRSFLRLPLLTAPLEVIDELEELFAALTGAPPPVEPPGEAEPPSQPPAALTATTNPAVGRPTTLENTMDPKDQKTEIDFYRGLAELRKLSTVDPRAAVLKCMDDGMAAQGDVGALLAALNCKTVAEAAPRISALLKAEQDLAAMKPKYDELMAKEAQNVATSQEADVAAAMQAHNMPANAKAAMLLQRRTDPEGFKRDYPMPEPGSAGLAESVATLASGGTNPALLQLAQLAKQGKIVPAADSPLDALQLGPDGRLLGKSPTVKQAPLGGDRINLDAYQGRNMLERAISYVRSQPDGKHLSFEDAHARAASLLRAAAN